MKFNLLFLLLFGTFIGFSQQEIPIEKKIKRFENAIRDLHQLGFNNDFKREHAFEFVLKTKDTIAPNCPIYPFDHKINISLDLLNVWIINHEDEFKTFILFLETYNRKNY